MRSPARKTSKTITELFVEAKTIAAAVKRSTKAAAASSTRPAPAKRRSRPKRAA
jgi:hypothetical protein